jgi:hypothetical protein
MGDPTVGEALTLDEVTSLREKTDIVSQILGNHLRTYVDTLRPLLAPRRVLGRHAGSRDDVTGSDVALTRLKELYRQASQTPFGLPLDFPESTCGQLDNQPVLYGWEYPHTAKSARDSRGLTISSPVQWVLSYECGLTLSQVHSMLHNKIERKTDALRQFITNALVMQLLFKNQPNLVQLLAALRYLVDMKPLPGLGSMALSPLVLP